MVVPDWLKLLAPTAADVKNARATGALARQVDVCEVGQVVLHDWGAERPAEDVQRVARLSCVAA
jgi:hypothetical protein